MSYCFFLLFNHSGSVSNLTFKHHFHCQLVSNAYENIIHFPKRPKRVVPFRTYSLYLFEVGQMRRRYVRLVGVLVTATRASETDLMINRRAGRVTDLPCLVRRR